MRLRLRLGLVRLVVLVPRLLAVARPKRLEGAAGGPERARVGEGGGRGAGRAFLVALVPAGRRGAVARVVGAVGEGGVNVGRGRWLRWRVRESGGFRRSRGRGAAAGGCAAARDVGEAPPALDGGARYWRRRELAGAGLAAAAGAEPAGLAGQSASASPAVIARPRAVLPRPAPAPPTGRAAGRARAPGGRRGAGVLLVDDVRVVAAVDYLGVPVGAGIALRAPGRYSAYGARAAPGPANPPAGG